MVEILVTEIRARRLSAAGDYLCRASNHRPCLEFAGLRFHGFAQCFSIVSRIVFSLFFIVSAPAAFLSPPQDLAL
jgi:hypothetical protein